MKTSGNPWDEAWKILTDPEEPWSRYVVGELIGEEIPEDWLITSKSEESENSRADRVIVLTKDTARKTIHLEFQSTVDGEMGLRMLFYGLQHGDYSRASKAQTFESLQLPQSYIIDVNPRKSNDLSGTGFRELNVRGAGVSAIFRFPVVSVAHFSTPLGELASGRSNRYLAWVSYKADMDYDSWRLQLASQLLYNANGKPMVLGGDSSLKEYPRLPDWVQSEQDYVLWKTAKDSREALERAEAGMRKAGMPEAEILKTLYGPLGKFDLDKGPSPEQKSRAQDQIKRLELE